MAETNKMLAGVAAPASQLAADTNAGVAFFLDVVVNMFVLAGVLMGAFGYPAEYMFGKIIPGAITGIMIGNLAFFWLTKKTREATGNDALTSIPLGLDLPSVFGMCFFIIGPTYAANVDTLGVDGAADKAWVLGMACTFWMAVIKFCLSFFGRAMQQQLPQMALVGAMAGIATVWLGAEALFGVFALPEVGIVSLVIMGFALIAGHRLPFNMPGAIIAIVAGTVLYYILAFGGAGDGYIVREMPELVPALPAPTLGGALAMFGNVTNYLGIIFPFALLIAASAVNVTAGARIAGDEFDAGKVVRLDAAATAVSALFGGVVQTTPYFGHATYKRMGARTGYALGAAGVITVGGFLGVIALASQMIPEAVLKPILVVVACDILRLAFSGGDVRHAPALLFATVPAILNYAHTKVDALYQMVKGGAAQAISTDWMAGYFMLGAMSRGYILTSLLWGALIVWIIDRKMIRAAGAALAAAIFTEFGIIHSVSDKSEMYLPWALPDLGGAEFLVHRLAVGYVIAAFMLYLAGFIKNKPTS
ncbi:MULTISPECIES: hypothetical protein [Kordiimonas]|jgi:AGZA family xanthine/uracil permease-like MFS transporter|uniref:hypothetical protein n=1 Tax=Kordiimonas TaxID=288021 RepID=UPI00257CC624|nr:hypothetical protein [Kordiimonas sp. UBA4487]